MLKGRRNWIVYIYILYVLYIYIYQFLMHYNLLWQLKLVSKRKHLQNFQKCFWSSKERFLLSWRYSNFCTSFFPLFFYLLIIAEFSSGLIFKCLERKRRSGIETWWMDWLLYKENCHGKNMQKTQTFFWSPVWPTLGHFTNGEKTSLIQC